MKPVNQCFSKSKKLMDYDCQTLLNNQKHSDAKKDCFPTSPYTISGLQNQSHDVVERHIINRSTDYEALQLWKGSLGSPPDPFSKILRFKKIKNKLFFSFSSLFTSRSAALASATSAAGSAPSRTSAPSGGTTTSCWGSSAPRSSTWRRPRRWWRSTWRSGTTHQSGSRTSTPPTPPWPNWWVSQLQIGILCSSENVDPRTFMTETAEFFVGMWWFQR